MADAKKPDSKSAAPAVKTDPFVEIIWIILTILIVLYLINGLLGILSSGKIFSDKSGFGAVKTISLSSAPSLLGDKVETSRNAKVYSIPGAGEIGEVPKGTKATLIEGPLLGDDGLLYWKVRFEDGSVGWVKERDLDHIEGVRTPLKDMPSIIGDKVLTSRDGVILYDSPGGEQDKILKKGLKGEIIQGPAIVDGVKYWHIRFEDGSSGWVKESDLLYIQNDDSLFGRIKNSFNNFFYYFKFFSVIISVFLIWCIFYLYKKIAALRAEEHNLLYPKTIAEEPLSVNPRWDKVLSHTNSLNESDWRLAIMEADIMLSDLLENMNLPGDTIGDKLKAVEKSDFTTIDNAWEAHKVRNRIAHDGSNFQLNERETKRVIALYETVFQEFRMI